MLMTNWQRGLRGLAAAAGLTLLAGCPTDETTGTDTATATDVVAATDIITDITVLQDTGPGKDSGPATCLHECTTAGAKQCVGNGVQTCGEFDDDPCLEWSPSVNCPGGQTCSNGQCAATCASECTISGATQCSGNAVETCGDPNNDGCLEWNAPVACPGAQVCSAGMCADSCTNECTTNGAAQCDGNGIQTCADSNNDGCFEWGDTVPCGANETCSNGQCSAGACQNECTTQGAQACEGSAVKACGDFDDDDCLEWGTPVPCLQGETCSNGQCSAGGCENECTTAGSKACEVNAVKECGNHDADDCLEWGTPVPCGNGETCSNGTCGAAGSCDDECNVLNAKQCSGNGTQKCGDFDEDTCLEWGSVVSCGEGQTCSGGNCAVGCEDECTTVNAKKCAGNGVQLCGNFDGDVCLEWGDPAPCAQGETCSGGNCAVGCINECSTMGAANCEGDGVKLCGDYDEDACLEWGTVSACAQGQSCSSGECFDGCVAECDMVGDVACEGNGTKECGEYDSDDCLEWGSVVACADGETCSLGLCAAAGECTDECDAAGISCDGDFTVDCGNFDEDACLDLGDPVFCGFGQSCVEGACQEQSGDVDCVGVVNCIAACDNDLQCALDCIKTGDIIGQIEFDDYNTCLNEQGCTEQGCALYYCTDELAACENDDFGFATCAQVNDCLLECPAGDPLCPTQCLETGTQQAQAEWTLVSGCVAIFCDLSDADCVGEATNIGGICGPEWMQCAVPDDEGADCFDTALCLQPCGDAMNVEACQQACVDGASPLGLSEYLLYEGCVIDASCADNLCVAANCAFDWTRCISPGQGDNTCAGLAECINGCIDAEPQDPQCQDICFASAGLQEQVIYTASALCLNGSCPDGDEACLIQAQQTTCAGLLAACFQ